ncbi:MAG TPA: DUF4149 domain-containing protein [Nitrospira sp.]|nr:DUF4149 domain-containing protein [Nitrospira sp.]
MNRVGWRTVCCLSVEFLALGVWVGGLIVLVGAVIPAVFNTFGGQDLGGFFLTRAFEGYNRLVVAALVLLLSAMGYRQWRGECSVGVSRGEWILLSAMGGIAGLIILVLHPQAAALQAEAFGLKDEQAKKAAFEAFFRLHKPIRSFYVVNVLLGIWLLAIKTKRSLQHEGSPA